MLFPRDELILTIELWLSHLKNAGSRLKSETMMKFCGRGAVAEAALHLLQNAAQFPEGSQNWAESKLQIYITASGLASSPSLALDRPAALL